MKQKKFDWADLITGGAEALIGILLLISSVVFNSALIIVGGIALCALSARALIAYFRAEPAEGARGNGFFMGLLFLALGVICFVKFRWFVNTLDAQTLIYGLALALAAAYKLQDMTNMLRLQFPRWYFGAISGGLSLIAAVLTFWNPFGELEKLWFFIAISMLVLAAADLVSAFMGKPLVRTERDKDRNPEKNGNGQDNKRELDGSTTKQ